MTAPSEKRTTQAGWEERPVPSMLRGPTVLAVSAWMRVKSGVVVLSSLTDAEMPDGNGTGPQWHLSISRLGARPRPIDVDAALRAFDMVGAEEDNHHPGVARQFWRPVDPARRVDCECKEDEEVIREADGYTWTNPRDGACRGCALALVTGRPCSLHGRT